MNNCFLRYFISSACYILLSLTVTGNVSAQCISTDSSLHIRSGVPGTVIHKNFRRASGELLLSEVSPWVVDEYIRHVDYTKISMHTIGYNLNPSHWTWDGDGFRTNQFGHPYHGSFFFNSFRTNGFNFWQSSLATVSGSYLWETFAENQAPAPNDLINTSFGGIVLGEMLFRLSNRLLNTRRKGFQKTAVNTAAILVNPLAGLNRIIDRKKNIAADQIADTTPVSAEFDIGVRKFRANNINNNFVLYARAKLMYGSVFENYRTPFSNIFIHIEMGNDDSSKINIVSIYGLLKGWKLDSDKHRKHILTVTANYDYIHNEAFFYSAQSVRFNLNSSVKIPSGISVVSILSTNIILLSAVPDEYEYKGRYYDYCYGIGIAGSIQLHFGDKFFCTASYRGGWLKKIDGNASHYFLHTVNSEFRYRLMQSISLSTEPGYFSLQAFYKNKMNVTKTYPYIRISVHCSLPFR